MKASYKQLKTILVLEVKNFGSASIVLKLSQISLFDNSFPNLANF